MIKVEHLTKRYGSVLALDDLSVEIRQGTVCGLIGPNGAGKTTLLRILAALTSPTAGQVWLDDEEVTRSPAAIRRKVGYMPDFFGVYPDLTSAEYLEFYAGISGVARRKLAGTIADLLELVNLSSKHDAPVETLSRGMKQRLCLARALIHDPRILLLDEPASGLDPGARVEFRELLRSLQSMGKTIVVSSHILLDLAEMCSHIAIIRAGHLVIDGDVEYVTRGLASVPGDGDVQAEGRTGEQSAAQKGEQRIEIRVLDRSADAAQLLKAMPEIFSVSLEDEDGQLLHAEFTGDSQALHRILAALMENHIPVVSFAPLKAVDRLEEVYMSIMEGVNSL